MNRYLVMLKEETEKNSQNPAPLHCQNCQNPLLTVLAVGRVAVYVKKMINLTEMRHFLSGAQNQAPAWKNLTCPMVKSWAVFRNPLPENKGGSG